MFREEKEETKSKYKKYSVCAVGHIRATNRGGGTFADCGIVAIHVRVNSLHYPDNIAAATDISSNNCKQKVGNRARNLFFLRFSTVTLFVDLVIASRSRGGTPLMK